MSHAFLSYVRENKHTVNRLTTALEKRGVKVWLDRKDIAAGSDWKHAIRNAIHEGSYFIACFSHQYNRRDRNYMNTELGLAVEELANYRADKIWFIPVMLSKCEIPDLTIGGNRTLQDLNYVELYKDWQSGLEKILRVIDPRHDANQPVLEDTSELPVELLNTLWQQYTVASSEDEKNRFLQNLAENGDPRVANELRRLPRSRGKLWIAKYYPIPEYVAVAIDAFGDGSDAWEALEFLQQAEAKISDQIKPEHLTSVVGMASYLGTGQDNENISHLGGLIWFIRGIGEKNLDLTATCNWIIRRILTLDLHPSTIADCLQTPALSR